MVYKKYIRKDGKLYGPYIYQSKRIDGKVVSEYCGTSKLDYKKIAFVIFGFVVLLILIFSFFNFKGKVTGNVVLNRDTSQSEDKERISISLKEGEFIPASSKISFETKEQTKEYLLSDLVLNESSAQGDYYLEGNSVSGSGEGYGTKGMKVVYPTISFTLILKQTIDFPIEEPQQEEPVETPEEINETSEIPVENNSQQEQEITEPIIETNETEELTLNKTVEPQQEETSSETPVEEVKEENVPTEEIPSEEEQEETTETQETQTEITEETQQEETPVEEEASSEPQSETPAEENNVPSITGGVISSFFKSIYNFFLGLGITGKTIDNPIIKEIQGEVSLNKTFTYTLKEGESLELLSGSVKTNSQSLNDNTIKISLQENKFVVITNYSELKEGFGEDYLGSAEKIIHFSIPDDLDSKNANIKILYENQDLLSLKEIINLNQTTNESIIVPETINSNLTEEEKQILLDTFGNSSIQMIKSELFNGRYIIGYQLEKYKVEYSYDSKLNETILNSQMERDRTKWLKDITHKLMEKESIHVTLNQSNLNFSLQ